VTHSLIYATLLSEYITPNRTDILVAHKCQYA